MMIHGMIHILGFLKSFGLSEVEQLKMDISKPAGIFWLITTLLLVITSILYLVKSDWWLLTGTTGLILSTVLIILSWSDARYGTIANIILLAGIIIGYATFSFQNTFLNDVNKISALSTKEYNRSLTEDDISLLPAPVQKYIRYSGAVGKPVVQNFKAECNGKIRSDENSEWMPFTTVQYNFMDPATRLFFMKAEMKGLPVAGYHHFKDGKAVMDIRLLSLFRVQYSEGREMDESETVTLLNDMCCLAPATLIDKRLKWSDPVDNSVDVKFTNNNITVTATLFFDEEGKLVNFISEDRYAALEGGKMEKYPWLTPLSDFGDVGGSSLARYAEAVYKYPTGDMVYGTFNINSIETNINLVK